MATFTVVASSTFTGADETPLSESGVWSTDFGGLTMMRFSNTARPVNNNADRGSYYSGASFNAAQYSKGDLTTIGTNGSGAGIGLTVLGSTSANTRYRFSIDHAGSSNAEINVSLNGVLSSVDVWTQTFVDGDTFIFAVSNETLYVYRNSALVRSKSDAGRGVPTTSAKPGISHSSDTTIGTLVDNWSGGNFTPSFLLDSTTSGVLTMTGTAVNLRPGSNTYLRYRK